MALLEIGRICFKRSGRNAGEKVIIVGFEGKQPIIEGIKVKRKKCNPRHLFPTLEKKEISPEISKEQIIKILKQES